MTMLIEVDINKTLRSGARSFELRAKFASDSQRIVSKAAAIDSAY